MLATDTEALIRATAGQTGEQLGTARARADASLAAAKARVESIGRVAADRTRAAGRATDDYVHANPWQVIAVGAAAGFLIGALFTRGATRDAIYCRSSTRCLRFACIHRIRRSRESGNLVSFGHTRYARSSHWVPAFAGTTALNAHHACEGETTC